MENKKNTSTLEDILKEDNAAINKKKRKGCLVRFLLILTILAIFFFGLMYIVQYMTDLEAEARAGAILTASASDSTLIEETVEPTTVIDATSTIDTAATDTARTATISAQLTTVVADMYTETAEPIETETSTSVPAETATPVATQAD